MDDAEPDRFPSLPGRIEGLGEIAMNLSWRWNPDGRRLFRDVDRVLWHRTRHNPIEILQEAGRDRLESLAGNPEFLEVYDRVLADCRREETRAGTWMAGAHPEFGERPVAYFCAEFALHNSVPIYSGGLGVLAGDHCKAASDLGVPLVGVGLLYTRGYFDQRIRLDGWQESADDAFDPNLTPLELVRGSGGERALARLPLDGREVAVGAWRLRVGRVPIYLLDTDLEDNADEDRDLTRRLYPGGQAERLHQEWILGAGGVRVLRAVGIDPTVWHANEGHAAFMLLERVREHLADGRSLEDALAAVRASSVFTTHTPVAAGHDVFSLDQVEECTRRIEGTVDRETLGRLGGKPGGSEGFHMTALAIRLSDGVNGVSERHGGVSRRLWRALWPDRSEDEIPIGHITNGVHLSTWMSHKVMQLLDGPLGSGWVHRLDEEGLWEGIRDLDDRRLWDVHTRLKHGLLAFVRERARRRWVERWGEAGHLVAAGPLLDPEALTIGFARRFAEYKRADLLLREPDRLRRLVTDPRRPVQILFSGKAHPADDRGKEILQRVYSAARDPSFQGRIAFLEDYELHLAHRLIQGVDLWLNLPRPPQEACGTSGMKAALNGVPQLGTCDGWWAEGFTGLNGWRIPPAPEDRDVDAWDEEHVYRLLGEEVVPAFYERDREGLPRGWAARMKEAIRVAGSRFTARGMVHHYVEGYYAPARAAGAMARGVGTGRATPGTG